MTQQQGRQQPRNSCRPSVARGLQARVRANRVRLGSFSVTIRENHLGLSRLGGGHFDERALVSVSCVVVLILLPRGLLSRLCEGARSEIGVRMGAYVLALFGITSLLMWGLPLGVLYAFNNQLFPGSKGLSQQSTTLWSGLLAVLSVNVVIVFYIILALREKPARATPQPDPAFLSKARASVQAPDPAGKTD